LIYIQECDLKAYSNCCLLSFLNFYLLPVFKERP